MKRIGPILMILSLMSCLTGCSSSGASKTASETESAVSITESAAPLTETAEPEMVSFPDFTVKTIDGSVFTLSEALENHDLVLVNFFATWCGPCEAEFPYLQEAWSQNADRVAVIALSIEPDDTPEELQDYAEELDLTFPISNVEGTALEQFVIPNIPTSFLVDKNGKIAAMEVGAKTSTQEFQDFFDSYSGAENDSAVCKYTVAAFDRNAQPVPGVVINFCTDTTCTPVTTDEKGLAVFTGPRFRYHVQVVKAPEGLELYGDSEFSTEPYGQTFFLPFENKK